MSDIVAAVSEKMAGTPSELVVRSAQARAQAQGVSVDEVLASWAGEGGLTTSPQPAPVTESVPEPAETPLAVATQAPEVEPAQPTGSTVSVPPVQTATLAAVEPEEIEPGAISDRLRASARTGAIAGAGLGLFGVVLSSPLLLTRLTTIGDPAGPGIEVTPLAASLTVGVASAFFGGVIAVVARAMGGFVSPRHALRGGPAGSAVLGALLGFVFGVIGMGILTAVNDQGLNGTALLSVRSTVMALVLGGSGFGAMIGIVTQAFGQPKALGDLEESSEEVRLRIANALFIPIVAALVILVVVIPLGTILIRYRSFASVIAIAVSALILAFASLMASRPNMAVTRGEVLTAIAGVGIVVALLALIAAQLAEPHEAEGAEEGEASAIIRLV